MFTKANNESEYQFTYENIEEAVESGIITWKQGLEQVALLTFEFARFRIESTKKLRGGVTKCVK